MAGEWLNKVAPAPAQAGYLQCRWIASFSEPQPRSLLVLTMEGHTWATTLAATQIDQLLTTRVNDEKTIRQLHEAKKTIMNESDKLSGKKACRIFSLIVAKSARSKRSSETVAYLPSGSTLSVNGMKCTEGVFTLVRYSEKGLRKSGVLEEAALRLLRIAHQRAVKLEWSERG